MLFIVIEIHRSRDDGSLLEQLLQVSWRALTSATILQPAPSVAEAHFGYIGVT